MMLVIISYFNSFNNDLDCYILTIPISENTFKDSCELLVSASQKDL